MLERKKEANKNVKHEIQTIPPSSTGTTAFPQVFATYLIFVQRNIFLGRVLCKYLLSKTRTCLLSCSTCYRILREGLFRCCKHTASITRRTRRPFPLADLIDHVTRAVYLDAKYSQNYSTIVLLSNC